MAWSLTVHKVCGKRVLLSLLTQSFWHEMNSRFLSLSLSPTVYWVWGTYEETPSIMTLLRDTPLIDGKSVWFHSKNPILELESWCCLERNRTPGEDFFLPLKSLPSLRSIQNRVLSFCSFHWSFTSRRRTSRFISKVRADIVRVFLSILTEEPLSLLD